MDYREPITPSRFSYDPKESAGEAVPPSYERVVRSLSDRELADERRLGRGEEGFLAAVEAEIRRRKKGR